MGEIGRVVNDDLIRNGVQTTLIDFPQNVLRDEAGYRRELTKAIIDHGPGIVVPIGNPRAMARFRDELTSRFPGLRVCVEDYDKVSLLDSKVESYRLAETLGIPVPPLFLDPGDVDEGTMVIFKRDVSYGGHGVHVPRTRKALRHLIEHQSPGEPYLIEKFIEGMEFSLDVLRSDKGSESSVYHCRRSGGNGPAQERVHVGREECFQGIPCECFDAMVSCSVKMLDALNYVGICGFDFIVESRSGVPYLLECNPRFTGGIAVQISSGFDIPMKLIEMQES